MPASLGKLAKLESVLVPDPVLMLEPGPSMARSVTELVSGSDFLGGSEGGGRVDWADGCDRTCLIFTTKSESVPMLEPVPVSEPVPVLEPVLLSEGPMEGSGTRLSESVPATEPADGDEVGDVVH